MTIRRYSMRFVRRGLVAAAVACACSGSVAAADPAFTREYPPTYSSRKAPWYEPFRLFTSKDAKPTPTTTVPPKIQMSRPIVPPASGSPGNYTPQPAWKWYGYGAPTPGGNAGSPSVPNNWYNSSGATPGAVPQGELSGVVPDPAPKLPAPSMPIPRSESAPIIVPPIEGPEPPIAKAPLDVVAPADVEWKSSAATIRAPMPDRPAATLKTPVAPNGVATPQSVSPPRTPVPPVATPPRTPAEAVRAAGGPSRELEVVPAPGIVMPPIK